ncbi:hypothetical protein Rhopal_003123-T1 [Rhodotorula paludigena]|uniref:Transcription factor IIIC 90kDa subunit N-terminal domain-containing protein n=1 Tax=Rhodotorula paludigena TaxID=86838 RepID=A0AAV5GLI8_9BASI|nr:hypothetical protein Rhopal_003123-T1 [Rhodotorula paludigena]
MVSPSTPVLVGSSNVPYSPASPSPSALVRSADGQVAAVARGEIHIWTPAVGLADKGAAGPSAIAAPTAGTKGGEDAVGKGKERERDYTLLRTSIAVEKKNTVKWGEWVDEYDINVPGIVEPLWRSAAFSPSGLSKIGTCILATITNNGEALLFEPEKDAAKGEWNEMADLTSQLIRDIVRSQAGHAEQTREMRREMVGDLLRCQTSAIAWLDENRRVACLKRVKVADEVNVINLLSFSDWTVQTSGDKSIATSQLAVADSDGRVFVVKVTQSIDPASAEARRTYDTDGSLAIAGADGRTATQFCWLDRSADRYLAYSKLGTVQLVKVGRGDAGDLRIDEEQEVELELIGQDRWMGATPWAACSGLHYLASTDSLLVALSSPLSTSYTASARSLFEEHLGRVRLRKDRFKVEGRGAVTRKEGAKVLGMVALESGAGEADVAFIFECVAVFPFPSTRTSRPDTFMYRTLADTRTHLVIGTLGGEHTAEDALAELDGLLSSVKNARLEAPLSRLSPFLHFVTTHASDTDFVAGLLDRLAPLPFPPAAAPVIASEVSVADRLETLLFSDKQLAETCFDEVKPENQQRATWTQLALARQLIQETLRRLQGTLGSSALTDAEGPFNARLLLAAHSLVPVSRTDSILPADALVQSYEQDDACPACKAPVPLANRGISGAPSFPPMAPSGSS